MPRIFRFSLPILVLFAALPAYAHILSLDIDDFYLGVLHPLTALEHIFPMLALGALAASQRWVAAASILIVFLLALAAGLLFGTVHNPASMAVPNNLNYLSFIVFGALVAAARPVPLLAMLSIALLFGVSHGYGNGAMLRGEMNAQRFCAGAFIAMVILITIPMPPVALVEKPGFKVVVRVLGSWVAAIGLMMMALEFAEKN